MERLIPFTEEHERFRKEFADFIDKEAVPYYEEWEKDHQVSPEFWKKMGERGYRKRQNNRVGTRKLPDLSNRF